MVQIILTVLPLGNCRPQELSLWAWLTMEWHSCGERPMAKEPDSTTLTQPGNLQFLGVEWGESLGSPSNLGWGRLPLVSAGDVSRDA